MKRTFYTLDVFTDSPLSGNPLAVVMDCDGLDDERMQRIAQEFNLSETVFVLEPRDPVNTARIRIFTPTRELPFAGHPTVGTAVLLGHVRAPGMMRARDLGVMIEERIGVLSCTVRQIKGAAAQASFVVPHLPHSEGVPATIALIAAALGLNVGDIGFDSHVPTVFSGGVPYTCVPIASLEAMARAKPVASGWGHAFGGNSHRSAYLYTRQVMREGSAFHTRMFFPLTSLVEDPATGSAAAAFAGVIMHFDKPGEGDHTLILEQGFEMGRPSLITLGLDVAEGALASASIGGPAVIVSQGTIDL